MYNVTGGYYHPLNLFKTNVGPLAMDQIFAQLQKKLDEADGTELTAIAAKCHLSYPAINAIRRRGVRNMKIDQFLGLTRALGYAVELVPEDDDA